MTNFEKLTKEYCDQKDIIEQMKNLLYENDIKITELVMVILKLTDDVNMREFIKTKYGDHINE